MPPRLLHKGQAPFGIRLAQCSMRIDAFNEAIPIWNVFAIHWVEPSFHSLDVVNLVFSSLSGGGSRYTGILKDEGASAFQGHLCESPTTDDWCRSAI